MNDNVMDLAQDAIRKGERARILFELLLSEIGMGFQNSAPEIWNELKSVQERYNEAVQTIGEFMKNSRPMEYKETGEVSPSNY